MKIELAIAIVAGSIWWLTGHHHFTEASASVHSTTAQTSPPKAPAVPGDVSNACVQISSGIFCPMSNKELSRQTNASELSADAVKIAHKHLQEPVGNTYHFKTKNGTDWVARVRMHKPEEKGITLYRKSD